MTQPRHLNTQLESLNVSLSHNYSLPPSTIRICGAQKTAIAQTVAELQRNVQILKEAQQVLLQNRLTLTKSLSQLGTQRGLGFGISRIDLIFALDQN